MGLLWFAIISVMLAVYVILDGFDLGAGALHLFLGRTDDERRKIIRSIGPVWDGNEVWLLATGGVLYFVFPQLYASSFSGFYLPLMMVLWLLMLRAIGLEFRTHIDDGIWASFFDGIFSFGSLLLAIFYGAALGNVVRGLPLGPDHYFFLPLWTNWSVGAHPGVLDWYTVLSGVVALVALCVHGANYIVVKTDGELNERARKTSLVLTPVLLRAHPVEPGCHALHSSQPARQLQRAADWIRDSGARLCQPGRCLHLPEEPAGGRWPSSRERCIWRSCWWERCTRSIRSFCRRLIRSTA